MSWVRATVMLGALAASGCAASTKTADIPPGAPVDPKFAPGDKFKIHVAREEALSGDFQVAEDGTIEFAPVGRVKVSGRTQAEVERELQTKLGDGYLRDPHVRIVNSAALRQVSVLGQVSKPGNFAFQDGLTLIQAVSLAGGLNRLGRSNSVRLTRTTAEGRKTFEVDLSAIIAGKQDDVVLYPGDVVFVPESPV